MRSDRWALGSFLAYLFAAYVAILFHFGKSEWFMHTDWAFIVDSTLSSVFEPVEQHWSTVPILLHRALFRCFGASYFPFLATVAGLHLVTVGLLRVITRRAGVGPWTSSIVSAALPLFGPGYMSIVFSVQITQNLSLALGLAHLLLADHDGPVRKRDGLGLLAGALGLMSSGLSPILVVGVGIATLLRRGWRVAALHTVPLGALYLAWFLATRPLTLTGPDPFRAAQYAAGAHVKFVVEGIVGTLSALGHFGGVALGLSALLVIGVPLARLSERRGASLRVLLPLSLLACLLLYFGILGYQRSVSGPWYATYSHHLYTAASFLLPALGMGADATRRRWPRLAPVVFFLLVLPVPFNVEGFGDGPNRPMFLTAGFAHRNRDQILAFAHSRYASQALHVDRSLLTTDRLYVNNLTVGWALDQAKAGRIPPPGPVDPDLDDWVQLVYGVTRVGALPSGLPCKERVGPIDVRPRQGELIETASPVAVFNVRRGSSRAPPRVFGEHSSPSEGQRLRAELPDLVLRLAPVDGLSSFSYCSESQPAEVIDETQVAAEAMRRAIAADPAAMEELRRAIAADPKAREDFARALRGGANP